MRLQDVSAAFVSLTAIAACQTVAGDYDRPARIIDADATSRAVLQHTVDGILGTHVTLSDAALTDSSLLTIEQWPAPTMENPLPQGRMLEPPVQFRLVSNGPDCILVDQRDRSRHVLADTQCMIE